MPKPKPGGTPNLSEAAEKGDLASVRKLLAKGVSPDSHQEGFDAPILEAAFNGHEHVFQLLCDAGADLDREADMLLWRCLICIHGDEAAARRMYERVAVGKRKLPPKALNHLLLMCSEDRSAEHIRYILKLGGKANYVDEDGESPLVKAVWFKRTDVVKELLAAGADANTIVPRGMDFSWTEDVPRKFWKKPVLELAQGKKLTEIVNRLIKAGASSAVPAAVTLSIAIDDSWKRIETWIKANAAGWKPLAKAATPAQIQKAQKALGVTLPEEFAQLYRRHNGSEALFPGDSCHYELMPLSQVVSDWKMLGTLLDTGDFKGSLAKPDKGVRKAWWHKGWIPFASNGGGDHYCVDLDPARGGTQGQVIHFKHESGERPLLAPSLKAWLGDFANELESGSLRYEEGEGLV